MSRTRSEGGTLSRVTIIGTGFIGTSIGLALKASKPPYEIVGHDREPGRAGAARQAGALDRSDWNIPSALEGAGIVILATPLGSIEKLLMQIAEVLPPGCVVVDTAPLKASVLAWATTHLSGRADFVGGHPIVDGRSTTAPSATLFVGRTFCIVPAPDASNAAVEQVTRLVQTIGAIPLFIDPVEHDSHMAIAAQVPAVLASVLMRAAAANPSWRDGQRLASAAFGDATALALTSATEQQAALASNRLEVARWIDALRDDLADLSAILRDGSDDDLLRLLESAQSAREGWRSGLGPESAVPPPDVPTAREHLSSWFMGRRRNRGRN